MTSFHLFSYFLHNFSFFGGSISSCSWIHSCSFLPFSYDTANISNKMEVLKCKSCISYLSQGTLYVVAGFNMTTEYFLQHILSSHFPFIQFTAILLPVKRAKIWEVVQCKISTLSTAILTVVSAWLNCIKDWNCSFTGLGMFRSKVVHSEFRLLACVLKAETHLEAHTDNLDKSCTPFVNPAGSIERWLWGGLHFTDMDLLNRFSVNVSFKVIK